MMQKKKKKKLPQRVPYPDAFKLEWDEIVEDDSALTQMSKIRPEQGYRMGELFISFAPAFKGYPAMLQVKHDTRLPTWDEIVWIRYHVCPQIEDMACILPRLSDYINYDSGAAKYTMTLEDISYRRKLHKS